MTIAQSILKSALLGFFLASTLAASAQKTSLQVDSSKSTVKFTLGALMHSVQGTFQAKPTTLQFDSASGQVQGQIVIEAKSGETGNGMRDRKMHKEVLESERYPEVSFRPDRVEGSVANLGNSSVRVHGIFNIHGVDRELTVPAQVTMAADHWSAIIHFTVPYEKWGMKNPSTLFLHVSDSVEIDVTLAGAVGQTTSAVRSAP